MQPSQVLVLVSVLFGLGGLLLGFLIGSAWAMRQNRSLEPEKTSGEPEETPAESDLSPEPEAIPAEPAQPLPEKAPAAISELPVEVLNSAISEPVVPAEEPVLPPEPEAPLAPIPPTLDPAIRAFTRRPIKPQPKPAAPLSIIDQINTIFGQMIAGTSLAGRNIHLVQDPSLGVTVQVGTERYEGIDSVPDEEIRAALKAAVKKWEEG